LIVEFSFPCIHPGHAGAPAILFVGTFHYTAGAMECETRMVDCLSFNWGFRDLFLDLEHCHCQAWSCKDNSLREPDTDLQYAGFSINTERKIYLHSSSEYAACFFRYISI